MQVFRLTGSRFKRPPQVTITRVGLDVSALLRARNEPCDALTIALTKPTTQMQ